MARTVTKAPETRTDEPRKAGSRKAASATAERTAELFGRQVCGTRRKDVIRLIITEGQRFPKLAEIYYHEVIARAVPAIHILMTRAVARGELPNDALARFPQLLVAPAMVALV